MKHHHPLPNYPTPHSHPRHPNLTLHISVTLVT